MFYAIADVFLLFLYLPKTLFTAFIKLTETVNFILLNYNRTHHINVNIHKIKLQKHSFGQSRSSEDYAQRTTAHKIFIIIIIMLTVRNCVSTVSCNLIRFVFIFLFFFIQFCLLLLQLFLFNFLYHLHL